MPCSKTPIGYLVVCSSWCLRSVLQGLSPVSKCSPRDFLDATQNSSTRHEADELAKHINTIEIALMCELWNYILQCFNSSRKLMRSNTIELTPTIGLLKSLDKCRGKFDYYEQQAGDRCGSSTCKSESLLVPKLKRYLSDGDARDAWKGCRASKRLKSLTTFYVIIDQLKSAIEKCIEAYSLVLQILVF